MTRLTPALTSRGVVLTSLILAGASTGAHGFQWQSAKAGEAFTSAADTNRLQRLDQNRPSAYIDDHSQPGEKTQGNRQSGEPS